MAATDAQVVHHFIHVSVRASSIARRWRSWAWWRCAGRYWQRSCGRFFGLVHHGSPTLAA